MDSITQVLLGSAVACAVAPKQYRKRAIITGAVLGTLPDLDVLIPYATDLDNFIRHRSFSHSLLVLPLLALFLTPLLRWAYKAMSWRHLYVLVMLSLVTHPLLDALTSYGTQLFWPFFKPVYTASVFIIDPFYSGWLLLGLLAYWITPRARWANMAGLLLSTLYLGIGLGVKQVATQQLVEAFPQTKAEDWTVGTLNASPLCWRATRVVKNREYTEVAFNVLAPEKRAVETYEIVHIDKASADYVELAWFNRNTVARKKDGRFISSDLRMGEFGNYLFEFILSPQNEKRQRLQMSNWQPHTKNANAEAYRKINHEEFFPKRKLKQFMRCLQGEW